MRSTLTIGLTIATALVFGTPTALAQQSTDVRILVPGGGSVVSRTFTLNGTSSQGGGSLRLEIDGLSYIPTGLRDETGAITEGVDVGETAAGAANAPFSFSIDLNGPNVVSSGGTDRRPVADGAHQFKVCQVLGPATGCSPEVTLVVSDDAAVSATSPAPSATPTPSASPAAVKEAGSFGDLLPVFIAALLGGLVGYGGYRLFSRR